MPSTVIERSRSLTFALLVSTVVLQATSAVAQTSTTAPQLDDQAATARAAAALFADDPAVRENAVRVLGERGDDHVLPNLQQALVDPNRRVRAAVIDALADMGSDAALWTLTLAMNDSDPGLREDAVYAAGRIGGAAGQAVVQLALGDPEDTVREAAAQVLEELSMADAREPASTRQNASRRPAVTNRGKSRSVKPTASPVSRVMAPSAKPTFTRFSTLSASAKSVNRRPL